MPVKTKRTHHRPPHDKSGHRRSKKFLKVYAPYIPLLLILGIGFIVSFQKDLRNQVTGVLSYAINMNDAGLLESANKERIAKNKQPLSLNARLTHAAQKKAEDMATRNYWAHNTPDGQEPWVFIHNAGYTYSQAAENLAYGFATSEAATIGWMNSPSHRANLLNGDLSEVGFGIMNVESYQNNGPQTIVVAMYGTPSGAGAVLMPNTPVAQSPAVQTAAVPEQKKITVAQSVTNGYAPWINLLTGALLGGTIMYLLSKHAWNLRRAIHRSERFILHHPLLDITLLALLALTTLLSQTTGIIH